LVDQAHNYSLGVLGNFQLVLDYCKVDDNLAAEVVAGDNLVDYPYIVEALGPLAVLNEN
jgi:hypothetical protein